MCWRKNFCREYYIELTLRIFGVYIFRYLYWFLEFIPTEPQGFHNCVLAAYTANKYFLYILFWSLWRPEKVLYEVVTQSNNHYAIGMTYMVYLSYLLWLKINESYFLLDLISKIVFPLLFLFLIVLKQAPSPYHKRRNFPIKHSFSCFIPTLTLLPLAFPFSSEEGWD